MPHSCHITSAVVVCLSLIVPCAFAATGDTTPVATQTTSITTVDSCKGSTCKNGANCISGAHNYTCNCTSGWTGWHCDQDVDDCKSAPCKHDGNCTDHGNNNFTCSCKVGWIGHTCETVEYCHNATCLHGASCKSGEHNYTCICIPGWMGAHCDADVDDCGPEPCKNGGNCTDAGTNKFSCSCAEEWLGNTCEIGVNDQCKANPCGGLGFCQNREGNYTCYCNDESTGLSCEVPNFCESNPCHQNEECVNKNNITFDCQCKQGYAYSPRNQTCEEILLFTYGTPVSGEHEMHGPYFAEGGFPFFGEFYTAFYVNRNGYIILDRYRNLKNPILNASDWPTDVKLIAPLWSHWDVPSLGARMYISKYNRHQSHDDVTLDEFQKLAPNSSFTAEFAFEVTWRDVIPSPAEQYRGFQNVTFQCIVMTDGVRSYAIFSVDDIELQSKSGLAITSGYSTANSAVVISTGVPAKRERHVYELFNTALPSEPNDNYRCLNQLAKLPEPFRQREPNNTCPCSVRQVNLDMRYDFDETDGCAVDKYGTTKAKCCYDKNLGTLLINEGLAGYPQNYNATITEAMRVTHDVCCGQHSTVCEVFYNKFPSDTCDSYKKLKTAQYWGSPVSKSADGSTYIFNGLGEYFLAGNDKEGDAWMSGNFTELKGTENITVLSAVTVQVYYEAVEAKLGMDKRSVDFYYEKKPVQNGNITDYFSIKDNTIIFPSGIYVEMTPIVNVLKGLTSLDKLLASGAESHTVEYSIRILVLQNVLSIRMNTNSHSLKWVPRDTFPSDLRALTFVKAANQLLVTMYVPEHMSKFLSTGLISVLNAQSVNQPMVDATKIEDKADNSTVNIPLFYSNFTIFEDIISHSNSDFINQSKPVCKEDVACLIAFDPTGTNNGKVIADRQEIKRNSGILNLTPPMFVNVPNIWNVSSADGTYSQIIKTTANASIQLITDENPSLYTFNTTTGNFTWNLTSSFNSTFKFVAIDSDGENATYSPLIVMCSCTAKSQCDYNIVNYIQHRSTGQFLNAVCRCSDNKMGEFCESTSMPCDDCFPGAACNESRSDNPCTCPSNLEGDGIKCYDKNECVGNVCGDHSHCENLIRNHSCTCFNGFKQNSNGKCVDINECKSKSDRCVGYVDELRQFCVNTVGSCTVSCRPTFRGDDCTKKVEYVYGGKLVFREVPGKDQLWTDALKYKDSEKFKSMAKRIEKVVTDVLNKTFQTTTLVVTVTEFTQITPQGSRRRRAASQQADDTADISANYEIGMDTQASSTELNDALAKGYSCNPQDTLCSLGSGSDAFIGVSKQNTNLNADFDLCSHDDTNNCHRASTTCVSSNGTFTCQCRTGFQEWSLQDNACEGRKCILVPQGRLIFNRFETSTDINECSNWTALCGERAVACSNQPGSYTCHCQRGYTWTDATTKCQLTDHCRSGPCQNGASCVNTPGEDPGYACKCSYGWTGQTCSDKDEEAERRKTIIIAVSASLGGLCFILVVALCCVFRRKKSSAKSGRKHEYMLDDATETTPEATRIPRPQVRSTTDSLEMVENHGSKTNLYMPLEEENALKERQESFNKHTKFERHPNPADGYTNLAYNGSTASGATGEYEHL